jgi:hypothetical protein
MSDITPPISVVDGSPLTADGIMGAVSTPQTLPTSLDVVNGFLDEANLASGVAVDRGMARNGAFTPFKRAVGANANQDFMPSDMMGLVDMEDPSAYRPLSVGIAGAETVWECVQDVTAVRLVWHIDLWTAQAYEASPVAFLPAGVAAAQPIHAPFAGLFGIVGARLLLYVDGQVVGPADVNIKQGNTSTQMSSDTDVPFLNSGLYPDFRYWTGAVNLDANLMSELGNSLTPTATGWHTAEIRLVYRAPDSVPTLAEHVRVLNAYMHAVVIR